MSKKDNISTGLSVCKNLFWTCSEPSWDDCMSLQQTSRNEVIRWTRSLGPCQRALHSVQQAACSWMVSDRSQKNYPTHSGRVWGEKHKQKKPRESQVQNSAKILLFKASTRTQDWSFSTQHQTWTYSVFQMYKVNQALCQNTLLVSLKGK